MLFLVLTPRMEHDSLQGSTALSRAVSRPDGDAPDKVFSTAVKYEDSGS